jgi:ATP-dependent RNA helicase DHX29
MTSLDTPMDSPLQSGTTTPRTESDTRHLGTAAPTSFTPQPERRRSPAKKVVPIDDGSDLDPDDLLSIYLDCKYKLFEIDGRVSKSATNGPSSRAKPTPSKSGAGTDPAKAKLLRKIKKIQDDILFDQYIADQKWEVQRILLERESARRRAIEATQDVSDESPTLIDSDDEVSKEAARIGAELLEGNDSDDENALADLFASLPVNEVDPISGKSITVINGSNGIKVTIRDFGKWTGVNPTRVLEEACRARYDA